MEQQSRLHAIWRIGHLKSSYTADREPYGTPRAVYRESLFAAEEATFPHTWDTVDRMNDVVVCVPHTPDPVLFGIRGESPSWVIAARQMIRSEPPVI